MQTYRPSASHRLDGTLNRSDLREPDRPYYFLSTPCITTQLYFFFFLPNKPSSRPPPFSSPIDGAMSLIPSRLVLSGVVRTFALNVCISVFDPALMPASFATVNSFDPRSKLASRVLSTPKDPAAPSRSAGPSIDSFA